jgi:CDP-6-deoxy-D-xylo-4-hexulose-3-dehydrase
MKPVPLKIPLVAEGISEDEVELLCSSLRTGTHTMGLEVSKFEAEFSSFIGVKNSIMLNSGSSANLLALESIVRGLNESHSPKPGSYIAVPAVLWPTTVWPIIQLGFRALLIDTLPGTLEIDFDQLEKAKSELKEKLVGAILIHPLGKSLSIERIIRLKEEFNLFIIEDNCESLGAGSHETYAGTVGDYGTFSFYYSHHMTTIEGGMVVCNDVKSRNDLASMRAHGWIRDRLDKQDFLLHDPDASPDFHFVTSGFNFRPMEIQGVLGRSQLKSLPSFLKKRWLNAEIISQACEGGVLSLIGDEQIQETPISFSRPIYNSWMAFPYLVDSEKMKRDQVREIFSLAGIATRPLLAGNFLNQPAGKHKDIVGYGSMKNSTAIYSNGFMTGNHHSFSEEQILILAQAIKNLK